MEGRGKTNLSWITRGDAKTFVMTTKCTWRDHMRLWEIMGSERGKAVEGKTIDS